MPDIQFNFGTEDLEGLRKLLAEIQKSLELLKKNVQDTGVITKETTDQASKYTAAQKAASTEVNKRLRAIKIEEGSIIDLTNKYKLLKREVEAAGKKDPVKIENLKKAKEAMDAAKKSTNEWGVALNSFQFKFNALGNIAANVLQGISRRMMQFAKDSIRVAGELEGIEIAFKRLNDPGLLNKMRSAVNNTVSDLKLMQLAVKANNFKIPIDEISNYLKFLDLRADQTGESLEHLSDMFFSGVGRQQIGGIHGGLSDVLGISMKKFNVELEKAGSFTIAVNNIIQEQFARSGGSIDKATDSIEQFNATIENLKGEAGKFFFKRILDTEAFSNFFKVFNDDNVSRWNKFLAAFNRGKAEDIVKTQEEITNLLNKIDQFKKQNGAGKMMLVDIDEKELENISDLISDLNTLIYEGFKDAIEGQDKESKDNIKDRQKDIDERIKMEKKGAKEIADILLDYEKETDKNFTDIIKDSSERQNRITIRDTDLRTKAELDADDKKKRAKEAAIEAFFETSRSFIDLLSAKNDAAMQKELANTNLTEVQKDEIKKKYARKQQAMAVAMTIVNTAQAIQKTFADGGAINPATWVAAGLVAVSGILQIAAIKAQKFAKGGRIGGKSHSQGGTIIEAEKDEFVVNKSAYAKNKQLIEDINKGKNVAYNFNIEDGYKLAMAMRQDKNRQKVEPNYTKELLDYIKKQPVYGETKEFFVIHEGNRITRIHKS